MYGSAPAWIFVVLLNTWPSNILGKRKRESASLLQGLHRSREGGVEKLMPMHPNERLAAPLAAAVADQANPKVSALHEVGEGNAMHPHSSPEFSSFLRLSQYTLQELPNNSVLIISNLVLVVLLASYCLYTRWQSPQAHDDVRKHISGAGTESIVFSSSSRDNKSGQYLKGIQRSYTTDEMTGMLMNAQVPQQSQSEQAEGSSSMEQYTEALPEQAAGIPAVSMEVTRSVSWKADQKERCPSR